MPKKFLIVVVILVVALFTTNCDSAQDRVWFDSIDKAIEQGMRLEEAKEIGREIVDDEILVLYKLNDANAVGIGSITTSKKGHAWFHGMEPYSADFVQLNYKTESNKAIPLAIGRVNDVTTKRVKLQGQLDIYVLKVKEGYYWGINMSEQHYEVSAIDE